MTVIATVERPESEAWPVSEEGVRFEWVRDAWRGRPNMGSESALISTRLMYYLNVHVLATNLGLCMSHECGYQIFEDEPKRVRFPDGSFVRSDRLEGGKVPRGHMNVAPDLVFEVISPNDNAEDVEERLTDFLKAGVRLVWAIYPSTRQIDVFRQDPGSLRLGENDFLEGEAVLPGFRCSLKDLFSPI